MLVFFSLVFLTIFAEPATRVPFTTPALGDVAFKQPPEFARRIFFNILPGHHDTTPWEEFLVRNRTPPYITAMPEITHRPLQANPAFPQYLILHSDGFTDLTQKRGLSWVISHWARGMTANVLGVSSMALRLLRQALGGDDKRAVSAVLTLDMEVPWIDDVALIVQQL